MTRKINKISVAKLEKAVDMNNIITIPLDGVDGVNIEITNSIPLKSMIEFVENVANSCVDIETGEYTPQVKDFCIKREVLTKYANFTMPNNIEKQYEFIYRTNAFAAVIQNINQTQYREILSSIDEKIKFMLDCITSIAASNTVKVLDKLETVVEQNSAMFDSVSGDDIAGVFSNINAIAHMDEEKLAMAVKELNKKDEE